MSLSSYQDQINRVEKDIADLHKKIADETKKEIDKNKQIDSINRSVTKSTSLSTLQSKQRQIQGYQTDILNCKNRVADHQKKIADKSVELGRKKQDLRKAEENESKKSQKQQVDFQKRLEKSISDQKEKLEILINQTYSAKSNNPSAQDKKEYHFFISHASEDKDEIVRDLATGLTDAGMNIWYDEFVLKVGDSLRKTIDNGLIKSKYGIVIISPSFIKKNWTEYELNGMVAREMNGHKVILPIWHKITKDEVLKYSPSLADKMALNTSIHTIEEIVNSLKEIVNGS
ncbi:MAG: TIR domain-containing protein [Desulfobacteraceae bacterium]